MLTGKARWLTPAIALLMVAWLLTSEAIYATTATTGSASDVIARRRPPDRRPQANCDVTSVGFIPLSDLGGETYQGFEGGLYPNAENRPPLDYWEMGEARAQRVIPRNRQGQPDPNGRIVLLSIGMSNTTMEYSEFKRLADADPARNPLVAVVDGAQGGQDAETIRDPNAQYWKIVDQRLSAAGVSANQVQAAWLKEAVAREDRPFPADAQGLRDALRDIVGIMQDRYPNLQLVYLSSRTYAGYATTNLNPEPYAYESGFAVKWLIEERVINPDGGVWLAWGPYLWTDGLVGRGDGFVWRCEDVQNDGTHPSPIGRRKVADLLLNFFKNEPTAKLWFVR